MLVHVTHDENHMATTFEFRVSCARSRASLARRVLAEAHALISRLEGELSEFLPESPIYRLNHVKPFERVRLTRAGTELLERSERLRRRTGGSFNCAAKSAGLAADQDAVAWDAGRMEAWRLDARARIGFGAIGKGYAIDEARRLLEAHGFGDYLLTAGGSSVVLSGFAGPGDPWKWGWSWSKDDDGSPLGIPFSHGTGQCIAIGVSGTHEKGQHIIDPRDPRAQDGNPRPLSALVGHASAADADALSTALFVSGWEGANRWFHELDVPPAAAEIAHDGVPRWNGLFNKLWKMPSALLALSGILLFHAPARADDAVDLGSLGLDSFTPYVTERNPLWALLPILAIAVVLIHLRKNRRPSMKRKSIPTRIATISTVILLSATIERAQATAIEPLGKALSAILGPKVFKKTVSADGKQDTVFYSKDASGKASRAVFIGHGTYEPNCTHTWAIGIDPDGRVSQVRPLEMACPHAFPTRSASFLDQFKGKGPADVAKLDSQISTVAKATGTSKLCTEAVKRAIVEYSRVKGEL